MSATDLQAASRWLDDQGECLHRYALVRMYKSEVADHLVQESFWKHEKGPKEWKPEPDEVMHRAEFWHVIREYLSKLPQKMRDVFTIREMDGMPSKEICTMLSMTDSNLWVMLHRAGMS